MSTEKTPPPESNISIGSIPGLINVSKVHLNVSEELIVTTEDKVRLSLAKHLGRMEKKREWLTPLGILVSVILTFVTSTFKDFGLEAATWKAVMIIWGIFALGWLIYSVKHALQSAKIEDIVDKLKKGG